MKDGKKRRHTLSALSVGKKEKKRKRPAMGDC